MKEDENLYIETLNRVITGQEFDKELLNPKYYKGEKIKTQFIDPFTKYIGVCCGSIDNFCLYQCLRTILNKGLEEFFEISRLNK